jgi:hypothetical protein
MVDTLLLWHLKYKLADMLDKIKEGHSQSFCKLIIVLQSNIGIV